jgi:hypothetical protein
MVTDTYSSNALRTHLMADWRAANECAAAVLKEARGSVLSVRALSELRAAELRAAEIARQYGTLK